MMCCKLRYFVHSVSTQQSILLLLCTLVAPPPPAPHYYHCSILMIAVYRQGSDHERVIVTLLLLLFTRKCIKYPITALTLSYASLISFSLYCHELIAHYGLVLILYKSTKFFRLIKFEVQNITILC